MVVSNIFYFHPFLGKWSNYNLTNIFQSRWNHQLGLNWSFLVSQGWIMIWIKKSHWFWWTVPRCFVHGQMLCCAGGVLKENVMIKYYSSVSKKESWQSFVLKKLTWFRGNWLMTSNVKQVLVVDDLNMSLTKGFTERKCFRQACAILVFWGMLAARLLIIDCHSRVGGKYPPMLGWCFDVGGLPSISYIP